MSKQSGKRKQRERLRLASNQPMRRNKSRKIGANPYKSFKTFWRNQHEWTAQKKKQTVGNWQYQAKTSQPGRATIHPQHPQN